MLAKMETNQEKMNAKVDVNKKMEARIDSDNEKFEVLRGTLVCRMDIHKARAMSTQ
jgi:hypothetical protein